MTGDYRVSFAVAGLAIAGATVAAWIAAPCGRLQGVEDVKRAEPFADFVAWRPADRGRLAY